MLLYIFYPWVLIAVFYALADPLRTINSLCPLSGVMSYSCYTWCKTTKYVQQWVFLLTRNILHICLHALTTQLKSSMNTESSYCHAKILQATCKVWNSWRQRHLKQEQSQCKFYQQFDMLQCSTVSPGSASKLPRTSPNGDGGCSPETWRRAVDTFPVQAVWSSWKCGTEPQTSAGTSRPGEAVGGPVVYRLFKVMPDSSGKCMVGQSHAGQGEWTWWPNASLLLTFSHSQAYFVSLPGLRRLVRCGKEGDLGFQRGFVLEMRYWLKLCLWFL